MNRLGYASYVAQGGDWGAGVTTWMAKQHVKGLKAIHLNLPILFPPPRAQPNAEEKAALAGLTAFATRSGYARMSRHAAADARLRLADLAGSAGRGSEGSGEWLSGPSHAASPSRWSRPPPSRRPARHSWRSPVDS